MKRAIGYAVYYVGIAYAWVHPLDAVLELTKSGGANVLAFLILPFSFGFALMITARVAALFDVFPSDILRAVRSLVPEDR